MKIFLIILGSIITLVVIGALSLMMLTKHIYNRFDCVRFNIDNTEIRAKVNIPAINDVECECNDSLKIKTNVFWLNKEKVDMSVYISANKLKKEENLFVKSGEDKKTKWDVELEEESGKLTVQIEYLDLQE